jgi:hypothetical protein
MPTKDFAGNGNYEKAMEIYEKFKEYILCVISDMKYPKDGVLDEMAG